MSTANVNGFLSCLVRGIDFDILAHESDRELVERALNQRDGAALQAIVHRHGAMVYRVCWRVLQHKQDTEDAFQATFLVLAQKLRTLRKYASLASWLHGVAHRVAVKARHQTSARLRRETRASSSESRLPEDGGAGEQLAILDAELSYLPDKWRLPLVLCYLEGRTQEETAKRLGWSKSTLRSRLDEARLALARRLSRRGLTLMPALSAVLLSDCVASASPTTGLLVQVIEAVVDVAGGKALSRSFPTAITTLTRGVLHDMFISKLKFVSAVLLACVGGALAILPLALAQSDNPPVTRPPVVAPKPGPDVGGPQPKGSDNAPKAALPLTASAKMKGTWLIVTGEVDGQVLSPLEKQTRWVIANEGITWEMPGNKAFHKFTVDADKTPKEIDLLAGQETLRGIYELDGNTLIVCWGRDRPSKFASSQDAKSSLMVLRREKGDPANEPREEMLPVAKVIGSMEGFRKVIPPDNRGPFAGTGMSVKELEPYTFPHLEQVAEGLKVKSRKECLALFAYLEDPDLKLRFIAAHAINKATGAYPNGLSVEAFLDIGSDLHRKMLHRFQEVIRTLPD